MIGINPSLPFRPLVPASGDQLFLFEITNFGVGICVGEYFPGGAIQSGRVIGTGDFAAGNGLIVGNGDLRVGNGLSAGDKFDGFTAGDFAGRDGGITGDEPRGREVDVSLARRAASSAEEYVGGCGCGAECLVLGG
ncbi:hypothetical protein KCU65_g2638, partial [Aureobasidium melanogenum]